MAPSHYLNQCWDIVSWSPRNKLQWNFNRNSNIFTVKNTFENVVCQMSAILSRLNVLTIKWRVECSLCSCPCRCPYHLLPWSTTTATTSATAPASPRAGPATENSHQPSLSRPPSPGRTAASPAAYPQLDAPQLSATTATAGIQGVLACTANLIDAVWPLNPYWSE